MPADMRLGLPISLAVAFAIAACRTSPVLETAPQLDTLHATGSTERGAPIPAVKRRPPGACATLSEAEGPDVLRVVPEEALALYVDRQVGLAIVDIANPDEPTLLATSRFTSDPVGVFDLGGVAVVVYAPWDRPPETILRAVDLRRPDMGHRIGELVLAGAPRDARRVGDVLVVTRDLPSAGATGDAAIAVSTFVLDENMLTKRDEIRLPGRGGVVGGSPWGVAVAREAEPSFGKDRTSVTWIGIDDTTAALTTGGTVVVGGVVPRWRRSTDHVVDVSEDGQVRIVGCATAACPAGDLATYAAIDFADPARPRLTSATSLARASDAAFNFSADRLFVARPPRDPNLRDATELSVFKGNREPQLVGTVAIPGTVSSMVLRGDHLVALGWTGTATAGRRAIVHDIDVNAVPRLVGSLSFGGDWTWSAAYDDDRALSFDPSRTLGALPMTTLRGRSGALAAVQVLSFGASGPRSVIEHVIDSSDRLLFVDGRLLSFSPAGVVVVRTRLPRMDIGER
jgi:hypothetical protein